VTSGTANFSKFVALGDSFTAGFSDQALFCKGQEGLQYLLAKQFALAGGGSFTNPLMVNNVGSFSSDGVQLEFQRPLLYPDK
jgi:hypothetical protein